MTELYPWIPDKPASRKSNNAEYPYPLTRAKSIEHTEYIVSSPTVGEDVMLALQKADVPKHATFYTRDAINSRYEYRDITDIPHHYTHSIVANWTDYMSVDYNNDIKNSRCVFWLQVLKRGKANIIGSVICTIIAILFVSAPTLLFLTDMSLVGKILSFIGAEVPAAFFSAITFSGVVYNKDQIVKKGRKHEPLDIAIGDNMKISDLHKSVSRYAKDENDILWSMFEDLTDEADNASREYEEHGTMTLNAINEGLAKLAEEMHVIIRERRDDEAEAEKEKEITDGKADSDIASMETNRFNVKLDAWRKVR